MKAAVVAMMFLAALGLAAQTNSTVNGATTYQTMRGIGSNIHSWSWKNGELRPALDALLDTLGHSMFRVIHERIEWAGAGSTRPATTLARLNKLDPTTLQAVYETPDMQDLWNVIGYLNSKGVRGDQIIVNFMGWTAVWMGGSGAYGSPSYITETAQMNQDIATMVASLVYYGHHRKDVSGRYANLSFGYISPFNESDGNWVGWECREGPCLQPAQMNTIYEKIVASLNAMGDRTTTLLGADNATLSNTDAFTAAFSSTTLSRMMHFAVHDYSNAVTTLQTSRFGVQPDFMTETAPSCDLCNNNSPPPEGEWAFGSKTADLILGDIGKGYSAVLSWAGFDSFWYHHDSYDTWGHVGCTQNGGACTTSDTQPRTYAIRSRAYPQAILAKGARPGMKRVASTAPSGVSLVAFYDPVSGKFALTGHNQNSRSVTLRVTASNVGSGLNSTTLNYVITNSNKNLARQADIAASKGTFSFAVPADTFYLVRNFNDSEIVSQAPTAPTSRTAVGR